MKIHTQIILALAAIGSAFAGNALAQQVCGPHDVFAERLGTTYQEGRKGVGLTADGRILELYVSKSGTWSVLLVRTDGVACVATIGESWQALDEEPVAKKEGS